MGGSDHINWQGLTGTLTKGELIGTIDLCMDADPPNWHTSVSDLSGGSQISKFFQQGDLEEAHKWCLSTLNEQ